MTTREIADGPQDGPRSPYLYAYDPGDGPQPPLHVQAGTRPVGGEVAIETACGIVLGSRGQRRHGAGPETWPKMRGCAGCARLLPDAYPTTARRAHSTTTIAERLVQVDTLLDRIADDILVPGKDLPTLAMRVNAALAFMLRANLEPAPVVTVPTIAQPAQPPHGRLIHISRNRLEALYPAECGAPGRFAGDRSYITVRPTAATCIDCFLEVLRRTPTKMPAPAGPIHKSTPTAGSSLCGVFFEPAGVLTADDWRVVTCPACLQQREKWVHAWRSHGRGSQIVTGCGMDLRAQPLTVTADPAKLTCPDCREGHAAARLRF